VELLVPLGHGRGYDLGPRRDAVTCDPNGCLRGGIPPRFERVTRRPTLASAGS
jgi:hypothetical protein